MTLSVYFPLHETVLLIRNLFIVFYYLMLLHVHRLHHAKQLHAAMLSPHTEVYSCSYGDVSYSERFPTKTSERQCGYDYSNQTPLRAAVFAETFLC